MGSYEITIAGDSEDADAVRAAFESVVNALRTEDGPTGSLAIDDVTYDAADVAEAEDFTADDDEAATEDQTTEDQATDTEEQATEEEAPA